jgi:hypothetical protein
MKAIVLTLVLLFVVGCASTNPPVVDSCGQPIGTCGGGGV